MSDIFFVMGTFSSLNLPHVSVGTPNFDDVSTIYVCLSITELGVTSK